MESAVDLTPRARVLIVDDILENIEVLAGALEHECDVQFALSGARALELVQQRRPDLILLDIMMPEMDGLETMRRLYADPANADIPVIVVTGDASVETHVAALDMGADDFLTKPIQLPVLRTRLRNVIERHRLLREKESLLASLQRAHDEIQGMMRFHQLLLSSAGNGIVCVDTAGLCTFANPASLALLGYAHDEIVGQPLHALLQPQHTDGTPYAEADSALLQTLADGTRREREDIFRCKDGHPLPVYLTVTQIHEAGNRQGVEVVFQDISERQRLERELVSLATTDSLTEATNRRRFMQLAEAELNRIRRNGSSAGLLMIDIDHFKQVNDRHGHAVGDTVLQHFAHVIRERLRSSDTLGRLGGEEFAVLLPDTQLEGAETFADQLIAQIGKTGAETAAGPVLVTASIGVTMLDTRDGTVDASLLRADKALYAAKKAGRNRHERLLPD